VTDPPALAGALRGYAERLHGLAPEGHHVASPLGAWLLLALCAPLAEGSARSDLASVLGAAPDDAARAAGRMIARPHPAVGCAVGVWHRERTATEELALWRRGLPEAVETGGLPPQAWLDSWARTRTLGLIESFPVTVSPRTDLVMATALATVVSWVQEFGIGPGADLGPGSAWNGLDRVLVTTASPDHDMFVADTARAGRVAVHMARSAEGLVVTSVVAPSGADRVDVLSAAHSIAAAEAVAPGSTVRVSLFDLPLGPGELWDIDETEAAVADPGGREERFRAVMPAWSAETRIDLGRESGGFPAAATGLARALGLSGWNMEAAQAAKARYHRSGFQAAAVTAVAVQRSFRPGIPGRLRRAVLHFGHPFAAVAIVAGDLAAADADAWHGLPVFSAWVARPEEAEG